MDIDTRNELETKVGIPADAVVTHAEMIRAFETFKNEARKSASFIRQNLSLPSPWVGEVY